MYCAHCGSPIIDDNRFCLDCGKAVHEQDYLRLFVGDRKAEFYFNKWSKNKKVSWNWPAFLFVWFWLGYRKLYSHLLVLLGLFIFIDMVSYFVGNHDDAIGVSFAFLYGLFGNYFYRIYAENKIKNITSQYNNEAKVQEEIRRQGGTSLYGILFAIGLLIIYVIVTAFIYTWLGS